MQKYWKLHQITNYLRHILEGKVSFGGFLLGGLFKEVTSGGFFWRYLLEGSLQEVTYRKYFTGSTLQEGTLQEGYLLWCSFYEVPSKRVSSSGVCFRRVPSCTFLRVPFKLFLLGCLPEGCIITGYLPGKRVILERYLLVGYLWVGYLLGGFL